MSEGSSVPAEAMRDDELGPDQVALEALGRWPAQKLDLAELEQEIEAGEIEAVIVATPDIQGKLYGKGMPARLFLAEGGLELSSGPLTYDNDWGILEGKFPYVGENNGWADMHMKPDLRSLRRLSNVARTAIVIADGSWVDGGPVEELPRRVLGRQLERCAERGLAVVCAVETEFYVFDEDYNSARAKNYWNLDRVGGGAADYSILHLSLLNPMLAELREQCIASGVPIESIKHEWGRVQLELTLTYCDAMEAADRITLFKLIAKEVAHRHGMAATFMARYSHEEAGSSGHVHLSVWDPESGTSLMADREDAGALSQLGRQWLGGQMTLADELMPLYCPNVNSYKRLDVAAFGPATNAWSIDVRTVPFRVIGRGSSLHLEHRIPGADANFYLALAGMVAAGLHGLDHGLDPIGDPVTRGEAPGEKLPRSLADALARFRVSEAAREAFGDPVVDHLIATAEHELVVFDREVTDVERRRSFECS
jgi:glutamine synthetase